MTVERCEVETVEIEVRCRVEYERASLGHRDRFGAPEEPDEPAMFYFIDAVTEMGSEIELTSSEHRRAEELAAEQMAAKIDDAAWGED